MLPEGSSRTELDRSSRREAGVEARAEDPASSLIALGNPETNPSVCELFKEDARPVLNVILAEDAEAILSLITQRDSSSW